MQIMSQLASHTRALDRVQLPVSWLRMIIAALDDRLSLR